MSVLPTYGETISPDWTDYNGHMNVAYYVLVFDHAIDAFFEDVGLDEAYRTQTGGSIFTVESHITYQREVMEGTEVDISTRVIEVDEKRIHLFQTMRESGSDVTSATLELMILHVNLNTRKTAPFEAGIRDRLMALKESHAQEPLDKEVGRHVGLR